MCRPCVKNSPVGGRLFCTCTMSPLDDVTHIKLVVLLTLLILIMYSLFSIFMYVGVMLFRSHMCVWYTTELQVMTLFVTLNVNMSIEQIFPGELIHDHDQQSMLINGPKAG